jgi:GNAT superfamily N-acetyltransferase
MNAITPLLFAPSDLSAAEFDQCVKLIVAGGAVSLGHAIDGMTRAEAAACCLSAGDVVAVGVLKNPLPGYRSRVFESAGVPLESSAFEKEIGYFATRPDFQQKGLAGQLLESIVRELKGRPAFATTGSAYMERLLSTHEFRRIGNPYKSREGNGTLNLLTRSSS